MTTKFLVVETIKGLVILALIIFGAAKALEVVSTTLNVTLSPFFQFVIALGAVCFGMAFATKNIRKRLAEEKRNQKPEK